MKTPAVTVPASAVAHLFLRRQHLDRPRGQSLSAPRLRRFVEDVGGLQIDSVNIIERGHYLTAWSRFGEYDRAELDRLIYRRRILFEYWAHAACFVPRGDFRSWRRAMLDHPSVSPRWMQWAARSRRLLRAVEDSVRENGPAGSSDFEHTPRSAGGWWNWKPAAHALHFLWMSGRLMVHSRLNFERRLDLLERIFPGEAALQTLDAKEFWRWHVRRSLHAMGAATEMDLRAYLTFPRLSAERRRSVLHSMLRSGEVVELSVMDRHGRAHPGWYALPEDVAALQKQVRRPRRPRGTTLLSPFDSFLWHRDRVKRLFGFDYRIEIYVPAPKRKFGYYCLPILHDGSLIGRVDAKNHRASKRLEIIGVHLEPWLEKRGAAGEGPWDAAVDPEAALAGLGESIHSLRRFTGATRVTLGRVKPAGFRTELKAALAASGGK